MKTKKKPISLWAPSLSCLHLKKVYRAPRESESTWSPFGYGGCLFGVLLRGRLFALHALEDGRTEDNVVVEEDAEDEDQEPGEAGHLGWKFMSCSVPTKWPQ